ncbi:MAG: FtsX-like permease family protein, partial [Vicinamibacterales bacterium]
TFTVVGVVGNVRNRGLERPSEPQVYVASSQVAGPNLFFYEPKDLVVRTAGGRDTLMPLIRRAIHDADPQVPISDVRALDEIVADFSAARLVQVRVLGGFAAMALLLAAAGLHGLLAFSVTARTREIGVRIALGASRSSVLRVVLGRSAVLAAAGVAGGTLAALAVAQGLRSLLFGVDPWDPRIYLTAAVLCVITALVGSLFPALRALRINPVEAIRGE